MTSAVAPPVGVDRFGIDHDTTFEARADTVVEMCRRGYAERMVLSQDASCSIDRVDPAVMALLPQWRYTHIHEEGLPYLGKHGVTDEQIETMLVADPRRYVENVGTYWRLSGPNRPGGALAAAAGTAGSGISGSRGSRWSWWSTPATTHRDAAGRRPRPRIGSVPSNPRGERSRGERSG